MKNNRKANVLNSKHLSNISISKDIKEAILKLSIKNKVSFRNYLIKYSNNGLDYQYLIDNWEKIEKLDKTQSLENCINLYGE